MHICTKYRMTFEKRVTAIARGVFCYIKVARASWCEQLQPRPGSSRRDITCRFYAAGGQAERRPTSGTVLLVLLTTGQNTRLRRPAQRSQGTQPKGARRSGALARQTRAGGVPVLLALHSLPPPAYAVCRHLTRSAQATLNRRPRSPPCSQWL